MIQVFNRVQLEQVLELKDFIEPSIRAFVGYSQKQAESPVAHLHPSPNSEFHLKAASLKNHPYATVKVAGWSAIKLERDGVSGTGMVAVFDAITTDPVALLIDDSLLTDLRTAAAGALAARVLAPEKITQVGILGTGIQAHLQTLALHLERPFTNLHLWGRDPAKAEALATKIEQDLPGVRIEISLNPQQVVEASDVIVTTTMSTRALIHGDWLRPGQHITAIGADAANKRELDAETLRRAWVVVDSREVNTHYGDVYHAINEGVPLNDLYELGEVLAGNAVGRTSSDQITVAKLVGLGVQDLIAAEVALEKLGVQTPR
jgi:ornithine cyclodeaminase/alanine dehydrogenase-like protein (mu-crystallin family)